MKVMFTIEEVEELIKQAEADAQIGGRGENDSFNMGCNTAALNMLAKLNTAYSAKVMANLTAEKEAV